MRQHGRPFRVSVLVPLFALFASRPVSGQTPSGPAPSPSLPPVNLGLTSFLDGSPPPSKSGFYAQEYLQYYDARLVGGDNRRIPGSPDLTVFAALTQFIYMSDKPVVPGKPITGYWGVNVIVPFVSPDTDRDVPAFSSSDAGLGDIVFGPFLQWKSATPREKGRWIFEHRLDLDMVFPTGEYDDDRVINPGSNYFSLNPYWAATLHAPGWIELSTRLHYLWNAENDDPSKALFADARSTRAGQAFHMNFAASYPVKERELYVGVAGYYLKQFTDSEVDGDKVTDARSQIFGIGPGILWKPTPDTSLIANVYFESLGENFTEGTKYVLRFVKQF